MNALIKAIEHLGKNVELQFIFAILLFLSLISFFTFLRHLVNRSSIKPSEGHGLGFFCKNTGKVFPINSKNTHIESRLSDKPELKREVVIRCTCGQIHGFDIPVRYTDYLQEKRREILSAKLP